MEYWLITLSFVILVVSYIAHRAKEFRRYFKKWGIPQPEEIPFVGFMGKRLFTMEHLNSVTRRLYDLSPEAKYVGCHAFGTPFLMLRDPELIKTILVKNFDHFSGHRTFVQEDSDPLLGKNLIFLNGQRWREVRNVLSPSFTASKMRLMFTLMEKCARNFSSLLLDMYESKEVEMKDVFSRYTNDVIATCAFGIEVDSLKDPNNEFYVRGKSSGFDNLTNIFKILLFYMFPNLMSKIGLRIVSKKDTDFFVGVIESALKARRDQSIVRPDMLQLMLDAKHKDPSFNLDLLDMAAQAFIFFLGGFETTASLLCMISYELATNLQVQEKLQAEIDNMMKQEANYESISNLNYLDAVFTETLRRHSLAHLNRVCTKEFELPPALPGSKPFLVKPGVQIMIPVAGIHHDPSYYEDPEKFLPERHLGGKKAVMSDVTSLGFGLGPRMCIGNRFAILETKVLLVYLLSQCSFAPCDKTCVPLEYSKKTIMPSVKGGCWLKLTPRVR